VCCNDVVDEDAFTVDPIYRVNSLDNDAGAGDVDGSFPVIPPLI
jgi:hypothetical protein